MSSLEFKAARKAKGMNQKELAAYLGVSYSAVTKWETGGNPVPKWVADKMKSGKTLTVRGLTGAEIAAFEKRAAAKGKEADSLAAELIRMFIKLSLIAFLAFHVTRSPKRWDAASLKQSASVAVAKLQRLAK